MIKISVDTRWTEKADLYLAQANALQIQDQIISRFGDKPQHLKLVVTKNR
jgi:hypothetical protein